MIKGHNINFKWKKRTIWARDFQLAANDQDPATAGITYDDTASGVHTGVQLATGETSQVVIDRDGPDGDIDWTHRSFWRVLFSSPSVDPTDDIALEIKFGLQTLNIAAAAASTELTTPIVAGTKEGTVADSLQVTSTGILAGNTLKPSVSTPCILITVKAVLADDDCDVVGLQYAYVPRISTGHARYEPPLSAADPWLNDDLTIK